MIKNAKDLCAEPYTGKQEKLSISGVIDVESFNDEMVVVDTELGILVVRGEDLHINKLSRKAQN